MDSFTSDLARLNLRVWPSGGQRDYWIAADGWPLRRFRLGSGTRGRMLLLNGRGDMIEKYLEVALYWAAQGWAVTCFDWRGQGGSGRLLPDPMTGHVENFSQWIDDLADFAVDWRSEGAGPYVMLGHSMGGHILLRALAERRLAPDAAVLVAPMLGLDSGPLPHCLARVIARAMTSIGFDRKRAWTQHETTVRQRAMRQKRLTHSVERYDDERYWRTFSPEIALGPPSWNWVDQAFRSTAALERSRALDALAVPLLILGTMADKLVSPAAIRRMAARLSTARTHFYGEEAAHEILRERDGVRLDALARIDAFLADVAP